MDQFERYDPDDFDLLGLPFAVPAGSDLQLMIPQREVVSAAVDALGRGTALVLVTGAAGSGRTIVAAALADALRGHGLVVDEIAQLGGIAGTALLHRVAPLLRITPERLAQALAAILPETAGAAVPDPVEPSLPVPGLVMPGLAMPGLAVSGRRTAASRGAGPGAWEPEAQDTSGLEALRAAAHAGACLAEGAQAEAALAVVVDDAGTWPTESLMVLAALARLRRGNAPLLQAVLVGDAALERRLAAMREAGEGGLSAPVSLRIPPLTLRQGREYLAHRFAAAGGSLERTVSTAAAREIVVRCAGNPGRIDLLADDCLVLAASQRRRMVTPAVVRAACEPSARHGARRLGPVICALLGATGGLLAAGAGLGLAVHAWAPAVLAPPDGVPASYASLPAAAPARSGADLFAGAGQLGTPASIDAAPATHGPADRPKESQEFGPAVPYPAAPSTPPSAPAVRTAPAPALVVPPPAPAAPTAPLVLAPEGADVAAQPLLLDPVPVAPALAAPDAPPRVDVPLPARAAPAVVQAEGAAGVADLDVPALSLPAAPPVQPHVAQAPGASAPQVGADGAQAGAAQAGAPVSRGEAPPLGEPHVLPPAAAPQAVVRSPQAGMPQIGVPVAVPHYDGAVVMHSARVHDTASVLLRRIWGRDDAVAEAVFRSLNPSIDAQGPWPAGTMVVVPQRTRRARGDTAAPVRPRVEQVELPTPPLAPRPRPEAIHDNPAGQVQSSLPYFCRSISPQNGAEDAYTRQVCGR